LKYIFLFLILTAIACEKSNDQQLIVKVKDGWIQGKIENGVRVWKGIPYASPPIDELRWTPPQPVGTWKDTLEANEYSNICP
jgi:para-nitrobenzyl esterase